MDITYFDHLRRNRRTGAPTPYRHVTAKAPEAWDSYSDPISVEKVTMHLEVDTLVMVQAFGRLRPGVVTNLGRTKVRVSFMQNQQGGMGERSFGAWELSPAVETPHERVTL